MMRIIRDGHSPSQCYNCLIKWFFIGWDSNLKLKKAVAELFLNGNVQKAQWIVSGGGLESKNYELVKRSKELRIDKLPLSDAH